MAVWRTIFFVTACFLAVISGSIVQAQPARQQSSTSPKAAKLILAARTQIDVTRFYDGAYVNLAYPNGDVLEERGVCTDVIIRAYRKAFGLDLQKAVHEDMTAHFSVYPKTWGLKTTDANIDHRRVPNLQTFFKRRRAQLQVSDEISNYRPGDLVTQMIGGKLPHIVIVSDKRSPDGKRPLVIHNIGSGTQEEDSLFSYPITGHYRYLP